MLTDLDVMGGWLNGQRVGLTDGLTDRWTDRETNRQLAMASCRFTIEQLTFAISTRYKNTGRGKIEI